MKRLVTLFGFSLLFTIETLVNRGVSLSPYHFVLLALAASMAGRAMAYLSVLAWLRAPFTREVPHSSGPGAGADNHPRYDGVLGVIGELMCCPICAGTWAAVIMLTVYKVDTAWGLTIMTALGAASAAWFISFATQWVEWQTNAAREQSALLNRRNRNEEQNLDSSAFAEAIPMMAGGSNGHNGSIS